MIELIIGFGMGILLSVAIAALIISLASRRPGDKVETLRRSPDRDYDHESQIAAARLRDIRREDIPTVRRINDNQSA